MTARNYKRFFTKLFYSTLHALFLLLLCWIWMGFDYTLEPEKGLSEKTSLIKKIFSDEADPAPCSRFCFIDVSGTKKLIPREGRRGVTTITDREQLAGFLEIINKVSGGQYTQIVFDIVFNQDSPDDQRLKKAMDKCPKLLIARGQADENGKSSIFSDVSSGYVGYEISSGYLSSGSMVKYRLVNAASGKSLPAVLYERVNNIPVEKFAGIALIGGKPALNNILLESRITAESLTGKDGSSKILPFEDVTTLLQNNDSMFFRLLLKDKIIVVGDFENDLHETVHGPMPGPLVLANVYLSLTEGTGRISAGLFTCIFIAFILISWILLYPLKWMEHFHAWSEKTPVGLFLGQFFLFGFIILLLALSVFLVFGFELNITMLTLYSSLLSTIRLYYEEYKAKKQRTDHA